MQLPENFSYSQQNLQDFVNCRRLFFLRYIQKQEWPALESEPVREHEELMHLGDQFHNLVFQQGVGIPREELSSSITDPILDAWWDSFLSAKIELIEGTRQFEKLVSIPFAGHRLIAKYDMVIQTPDGQALIYDWKTSQREPQRKWLQANLQTRVYPFILALKKDPPIILPENISMTYWYPAFPNLRIVFDYSKEAAEIDREFLTVLINEIESLEPDQYEKTDKEKLCAFCRYRSLCERGEKAGDYRQQDNLDLSEGSAFDIDFNELSPQD